MKRGAVGDRMTANASGRPARPKDRALPAALILLVCAVVVGSYASLPTVAGVTSPVASPSAAITSPAGTTATPVGVGPTVVPPTLASSIAATPWTTPKVTFDAPGPHLASWGGPAPPGAPTPEIPHASSGGGWWGGNESGLNTRCAGIWPSTGGQSQVRRELLRARRARDRPGTRTSSGAAGT